MCPSNVSDKQVLLVPGHTNTSSPRRRCGQGGLDRISPDRARRVVAMRVSSRAGRSAAPVGPHPVRAPGTPWMGLEGAQCENAGLACQGLAHGTKGGAGRCAALAGPRRRQGSTDDTGAKLSITNRVAHTLTNAFAPRLPSDDSSPRSRPPSLPPYVATSTPTRSRFPRKAVQEPPRLGQASACDLIMPEFQTLPPLPGNVHSEL